MEVYTGFARVYDQFMDNIPYEEWGNYLKGLLCEYGVPEGLLLELGCGTGNITKYLQQAGYDMIGIDNAEEMLAIAKEKTPEVLYLLQDMREFELYGTVNAVVSICDSLNYIMSEEELVQVFKRVNNYLETEGVFIFDLNTEYKYKELLADQTIAENREACSFIWENYYYEEEGVNEYDLTIYIQEEGNHYSRFDETHYQKAYSLETIKKCLTQAGMDFVTAYDAFSREAPRATSERIYVVAKEAHQAGKFYL